MTNQPSDVRVLVCRCSTDNATEITRIWANDVVDELRQSPCKFVDLAGDEVTPRRFNEAVEDFDPAAIFLFGHGQPRELLGSQSGRLTPLLGFHNAQLTRGRILWTLACWSAAQLGPKCVDDHGCLAYSGYDTEFSFYRIDPYFEGFKECAIEPFLQLVRGETTGRAHDSAGEKRTRLLSEWQGHTDRRRNVIRAAMRNNMLQHKLIGRRDIRLFEPPLGKALND